MINTGRLDPTQCARELLERLNVQNVPIPVEKIAKAVGAQVVFSPLDDELSGMVLVDKYRILIGVNSLHHSNRQRFTVAHEIGHLTLHRDFITDQIHVDKKFMVLMRDPNSATGTDRLEIEANRFAAELLMPKWAVHRVLENKLIDIDDDRIVADLAKKFRVSRQALQYRLINIFSS
jgi:Zn-dependent peptidase ImmA (M78 family)